MDDHEKRNFQLNVRSNDLIEVINELERVGMRILFFLFSPSSSFSSLIYSLLDRFSYSAADKYHIDCNQIALVGHSFGSASICKTSIRDKRYAFNF
jgi:hypothetical protein